MTLPTFKFVLSAFEVKFLLANVNWRTINNNNIIFKSNNKNAIYTVNYLISITAGIDGRTVFMNILTGLYIYVTGLKRITCRL